jgi:hypothetical protein
LLLKVFGNTFSRVRMAEITDKTKTRIRKAQNPGHDHESVKNSKNLCQSAAARAFSNGECLKFEAVLTALFLDL